MPVPRGAKAENGATRIAPNGYHYTKKDGKWYLTHRMIVEEKLGRPMLATERCFFIDGDKTNVNPENIGVNQIKAGEDKKIAEIEEKIAELKKQLKYLKESKKSRA